MSRPLVSIIVPCYKQACFLPATLYSVLNQTYENWECIVVNDGSPDNTSEVAEKFISEDSRFVLLEQENQGLAMARNNGIRKSHGEFILPLDSDDLIAPSYIEKAINYFIKNPKTKLVYCKADRFDRKREFWDLPEYKYEDEIWQNLIFCSAIYKRADFDKTNGYNPNMKGGFEDWDFWLSFLNKDDIVYRIPEILFHYRFQRKSMLMNASKNREHLYRQIYLNHPEIYVDYVQDVVIYKNTLVNQEWILKNGFVRFVIDIIKFINKIKRKMKLWVNAKGRML